LVQDQQLPQPPTEDELRRKAEKAVKEKVGLYSHIGTYIVVNIFLVVIWLLSGHGYPWFLWVMAGWGLGLAMHIFGYYTGRRSDAMKNRMVEKEMERLKSGKDQS
jgi:hypothetical protein